ncbi:Uncharacterised protein [Mycobacteroides abscessus subsp. abscessus]|nr:Uncharacterised protein [Mycobacteroides abscessus subsp. abscessus]
MQHSVIDGKADHVAEWPAAERGGVVPVAGHGAAVADHLTRPLLQVEQIDTRCGQRR